MKILTKLRNLLNYPRLPVKHLKKDCVNLIDIPTGLMPRQKADAYIKKVMGIFNTMKSDDYHVIYLGRGHNMPESSVKYLAPGVFNVLEVDVGMLKDERAEKYIEKMNNMVQKIEGYNIVVVPKAKYRFDRNIR